MIAVLHDLNLAARLAKRIIVLQQGRTVADDTPANTITDEIAREVFEVADAVLRMPPPGMPFVLPRIGQENSRLSNRPQRTLRYWGKSGHRQDRPPCRLMRSKADFDTQILMSALPRKADMAGAAGLGLRVT